MISDRTAVTEVLRSCVEAGHTPTHVDYGDGEVVKVNGFREAVDEVMSVDHAYVIFGRGKWVHFVLGNGDPLDLIADHTLNLSSVIDPIMERWG